MLLLLACTATSLVDHTPDGGRASARQIDLARALIEDGLVPTRNHWTTEGVLSGHALSSALPEDCEGPCPRAWGAQLDPIDGGGAVILFHVAIREALNRLPKRIVVVVDTSGSMGVTKLDQVRSALTALASNASTDDMLGLVSFADAAKVELSPTLMDERGLQGWTTAVGNLEVQGGTNTADGVLVGYEELFEVWRAGADNRLILLTDDRPEELEDVLRMARVYGEAGAPLHLTALGVDLGADMANEVEATAGGRYHFVDNDDIDSLFAEPLVTPACIGTGARIEADESATWAGTLGFPMVTEPDGDRFRLPTLAADMTPLALVFRPEEGFTGWAGELQLDCLDQPISLEFHGGTQVDFTTLRADDAGVFKMGALLDEAQALDIAAAFCDGDVSLGSARPKVRQAADRLLAEADLLDDEDLEREADLVDQLWNNLEAGEDACF